METVRNDSTPREVRTGAEAAAREAAQTGDKNDGAQSQLAQGTSPPDASAPEQGRAAAAASSQDDERGSVLQEFLADGPPEVEEGRGETGQRRPVQMQDDQMQGEAAAPDADERPPMETAADDLPVSGGISAYREISDDSLPDLTPTLVPADLAGDPVALDGADSALVVQFGDPLALSSLAAGTPLQNVAVPSPIPIPSDPTEPDPLTEARLAAGDDNLVGTDADEALSGGVGNDTLDGAAGDDTLDGGAGDDLLTGGDGQDIFVFSTTGNDGNDVVTDFTTGSSGDTLRLTDVTDANNDATVDLADLDADAANTATGDASGVNLGLAGGTTVTLVGVDGTGIDSFTALAGSGVNVDIA